MKDSQEVPAFQADWALMEYQVALSAVVLAAVSAVVASAVVASAVA